VLLPGDYCKAETINVLLPGAEARGNAAIKGRRTGRTL